MVNSRSVAKNMSAHVRASDRRVAVSYMLGQLQGGLAIDEDTFPIKGTFGLHVLSDDAQLDFSGIPKYEGRERPLAAGISDAEFAKLEGGLDYLQDCPIQIHCIDMGRPTVCDRNPANCDVVRRANYLEAKK